jgi:hypothetical protein
VSGSRRLDLVPLEFPLHHFHRIPTDNSSMFQEYLWKYAQLTCKFIVYRLFYLSEDITSGPRILLYHVSERSWGCCVVTSTTS